MKKFLKGLFSSEEDKEFEVEQEKNDRDIDKEIEERRQRERDCERNLKMINRISTERFEDINKIKPDVSSRDIRLSKLHVDIQCSKCLSVVRIHLKGLITEEKFMEIINVECNECDEVFERLTNKYNEKIKKEERIIENMPVGSRVKVYNCSNDNYSFGTIVEYKIHDKSSVKFSLANSYFNNRLDVKSGGYNRVVVMLDRGLEYITWDLNNIEKYDNRLTQSEIEYITSLLERHSIDNYASASIVSMNKEIISKISIDK